MTTPDNRAIAWGDELVKLHDGFRTDLAELRNGGNLGHTLREHCLIFCEALQAHHTGEENVLFPHLQDLHPDLTRVLERLRAEHHTVAHLLNKIRTALSSGNQTTLNAELEHLTSELEAHLDYEEAQLVPVLNTMNDMPEDI